MSLKLHDEAVQEARRLHLLRAEELYQEYLGSRCHPTWLQIGLFVIWLFVTAVFGHCLQAINPLTGPTLDFFTSGLFALAICVGIKYDLQKAERKSWNDYLTHAQLPLPGD